MSKDGAYLVTCARLQGASAPPPQPQKKAEGGGRASPFSPMSTIERAEADELPPVQMPSPPGPRLGGALDFSRLPPAVIRVRSAPHPADTRSSSSSSSSSGPGSAGSAGMDGVGIGIGDEDEDGDWRGLRLAAFPVVASHAAAPPAAEVGNAALLLCRSDGAASRYSPPPKWLTSRQI